MKAPHLHRIRRPFDFILLFLLFQLALLPHSISANPSTDHRDLKEIKGIQGHDWDDAALLGAKHGVVNINVPALIARSNENSSNILEWTHPDPSLSKIRWNFRKDYVDTLDRQFLKLHKHQIRAYGILLAYRHEDAAINRLMLAPEALETKERYMVAGWSIMQPEGKEAWSAVIRFLSQRYGEQSQIGHCYDWIVSNEVNSHFMWHYVGDKSLKEIAVEYEEAMRLTWQQTSPSDPRTKIYASLDHFWAKHMPHGHSKQACSGRDLLLELAKLSRQNGAYPWEIAFHPYPQDLFNPQTWLDDQPTKDLDTPILNFKNLHLLPRFLKSPEMLHPSDFPREREIILSEQGFHCGEGNQKFDGETLQATAFAYAWEKIRRTPEIKAFIYHRQIDHAHEGGLKLGLRENVPGSISDPGKARKSWELFQKAGTPAWEEASAFALPILGIKNWDDIFNDQ